MCARHKLGGGSGESILVSQLQHGLTLEFEHSDSPRRLRLVLSELLAIMNKVNFSIAGYLCVLGCTLDWVAHWFCLWCCWWCEHSSLVLTCFIKIQSLSLIEQWLVLKLFVTS